MAETKIFQTEDGKSQKTIDGFDNFISRVGLNNNNTLSAGTYAFNLITRNRIKLEAAYRGSWIVGRVVDSIADDMTKAGIDIVTTEDQSDIKDIQAAMSRLQIWNSVNSIIKWSRLYGGSIGFLQIEGQDPSTPLSYDTISKGQFQGIVVYDRWQLYPDLTQLIDFGPDMGLPKYYYVVNNPTSLQFDATTLSGQIKIHHSRVIRGNGIKLPYFQAITEMMWGESILERLWDRLISFDTATMSSANLIERANNRTISIENFREIVGAGGMAQQGLEAQFEMMRQFQTNEGMTLLDKNDTFQTTSYSFAGLSDMLIQFGQQLAGAAETPLVRLFGQSPAGMNATGESDLRTYYDYINAKQESEMRLPFEKIFKVMWPSVYGKPAPKDLTFTFNALWQMSATEKSTIAATNTQTIIAAEEAGLINKKAAMLELKELASPTGLYKNISDEDINEADVEADIPPEPTIAEPLPPEQNEPTVAKDSLSPGIMKRIKSWVRK